jgi:hypothetical protein
MANLIELRRKIPYKWRPQYAKNKETGKSEKVGDVAYIDARDAQDLLDEVVGPENWQSDFKLIDGKLFCGIGINVDSAWVWKWDCGTESNIEEEKGQVSDAFKRACVQWGIGRFLYSLKARSMGVSFSAKRPDTERMDVPSETPLKDSLGKTYCSVCGKVVSEKVRKFSNDQFGKTLCMSCQAKE